MAMVTAPYTYQHQRRAHFRLLPSQKVTFIRQATVRPDLPLRAIKIIDGRLVEIIDGMVAI